jgi:hypothetical protein
VRPERFERPTPWFVGVSITKRIVIYQCLASVRHTQEQSKPATGTPSKHESGTVLTTVDLHPTSNFNVKRIASVIKMLFFVTNQVIVIDKVKHFLTEFT